jgi:hypothetical protein
LKQSTKLLGQRHIPEEKVAKYLLNVDHPDGGGKAKFFIAHGFDTGTPSTLASAIHSHADHNDIVEAHSGPHGTKSIVRCSIPTPDGRNPCILVVWIREKGCAEQRLVTAYPYDDRLTIVPSV